MDKNTTYKPIKENTYYKIDNGNINDDTIKDFGLFTGPVKDFEGKVIEPAINNNELKTLFDSLPKEYQQVFLQVMRETVNKLNTNLDIKRSGK